MWTQHLPVTKLRQIDRSSGKIIVEQGGKHHLVQLRCTTVEKEYKAMKIKGLFNLLKNNDNTVAIVRQFENSSLELGHNCMVKEAAKFGQELEL